MSDLIDFEGEIIDVLPNQTFLVKLDPVDQEVRCYVSGKMRKNGIRLVLGDRVKIEMSPYDLTKGRIVFRL